MLGLGCHQQKVLILLGIQSCTFFFPLQYVSIVNREVMERLRLVRALDPQAILTCPRCQERDRGSVPDMRLSWQGIIGAPPSTSSQPHIRAARLYIAHLQGVHQLSPSDLRRKDLPVVLWSPRDYEAVDLLLTALVDEFAVSSLMCVS